MAKKEINTYIKLQIPAGQASPSPPVGPALGQHGLPLMDFCNAFNVQYKIGLDKKFLIFLFFILLLPPRAGIIAIIINLFIYCIKDIYC